MYLSRKLDEELLKWKVNGQGKPLLISGARQVGRHQRINAKFISLYGRKKIRFWYSLFARKLFRVWKNQSIPVVCRERFW